MPKSSQPSQNFVRAGRPGMSKQLFDDMLLLPNLILGQLLAAFPRTECVVPLSRRSLATLTGINGPARVAVPGWKVVWGQHVC